ncbi:MAG: single-stranded-DNA-specific exonuclease RecJ [bacterium]|nr:single-stranded-DNA-specific exonuclease RecJ [bacterium]
MSPAKARDRMARMKYSVRERSSDIVSDLLAYRGIVTEADRAAFLAPDYDAHTHDPFLMKGMDLAVERIYRAIKTGERIVIFSDYDADGIPGGVILHDTLKKLGYTNFENYIPHRHNEGFGLSLKAIEGFAERGTKLLVTIDCGIGNIAEVARANELGIETIITDHHLPHREDGRDVLPPAYAILDPKQADCGYPEKMLCGSGVMYKLVQALFKKHGEEFGVKPGWEKWYLDLVGIATLSDMVPLVGENRVFAHYGLKVLRKTARPGLTKLYEKLRLKRDDITEDDIGFTITPRINAASRMGEPEHAFKLLSTDDEALADVYADALEHVNNERKGTVASLVKEIRKLLAERDVESKKAIVIGNPSWRPSLLGLVANSLAEEYGKPAFLWGRDGDGILKGSCRSAGNGSVVEIMSGAKEMFREFGGHAASGGFALLPDSVHMLEDALCKSCEALFIEKDEKESFVDVAITLEDVSWSMYRDIEKLAPYGTGNPKPLFLIRKARIGSVKAFGKEKNHTEIIFDDSNGRKISAIRFFFSAENLPSHVTANSTADFVVQLEKSTFKRYPELRLRIVDIL